MFIECGVGMCPGVRLQGWLRWFAHPFVVLSAGGFTLLLLLTLQKSGSWVVFFFFGFVSFGPEFAPIVHVQLFLVSYSFFVFCILRRGVSRCKLCLIAAKGPGSQTCLSLFPINL